MTQHLDKLMSELIHLANPAKAKLLAGFFKTGPGQYGAGDKFLGIMVPQQRELVKKYYREITVAETEELLHSLYHEARLTALLILVAKFKRADKKEQKQIFQIYLKNTKFINNWDLVDLSAPNIVGAWLFGKDRAVLHKLAHSPDLWKKRIAVLATFYFIREKDFTDALQIAKILLPDEHDLIHKAVGWMLREIGKRDITAEEVFLKKHAAIMPRTMLRYAIEKFPETKRKKYLNIK